MTPDAILRAFQSLSGRLTGRLQTLLRRGLLTRVKYADNVRLIQVKTTAGQPLDDIEHIEPFGFTSHPKAGAEAVVLAFGGNSSHTIGLVVGDRRFRMVIDEGDVAVYNSNADYLHLKANGEAILKSSTKVTVDSPTVDMTGALNVTGAVSMASTLAVNGQSTLTGDATIAGKSFSSHKHPHGNRNTGTPI